MLVFSFSVCKELSVIAWMVDCGDDDDEKKVMRRGGVWSIERVVYAHVCMSVCDRLLASVQQLFTDTHTQTQYSEVVSVCVYTILSSSRRLPSLRWLSSWALGCRRRVA